MFSRALWAAYVSWISVSSVWVAVYNYCVIKAQSEVATCVRQAGLSDFQRYLAWSGKKKWASGYLKKGWFVLTAGFFYLFLFGRTAVEEWCTQWWAETTTPLSGLLSNCWMNSIRLNKLSEWYIFQQLFFFRKLLEQTLGPMFYWLTLCRNRAVWFVFPCPELIPHQLSFVFPLIAVVWSHNILSKMLKKKI